MVAFPSLRHRYEDQTLESQVLARLRALDPLRYRRVSVSARDGVVVLLGYVASHDAKTQGYQHVTRMPGVKSVVNGLQIASFAQRLAVLN